MSAYVERELRRLSWQPKRFNLARKMKAEEPLLCSGYAPVGFRLLSISTLRRGRPVDESSTCAGVYFLWDNDRLAYIGSSENVYTRVLDHLNGQRISFNYATLMGIGFPWHLSVEAAYIVAYLPKSNIRHTTNRRVIA